MPPHGTACNIPLRTPQNYGALDSCVLYVVWMDNSTAWDLSVIRAKARMAHVFVYIFAVRDRR
jgi:hypothetical protein